jgi:branched-chain amino acid transport system substrate-binding protein
MRMQLMVQALVQAMQHNARARRSDAIDLFAVATQLEKESVSLHGQSGSMRALDHQFQQPLVVGVMERVGTPGVKFDVEGSGYGFRVVRSIAAARAEQPSSCHMQRPTS